MKGFEVDPEERAFVRSKLPPELKATVDNAEARMNNKIDELVKDFKETIQTKISEFTERDFSAELEEKLAAEEEAVIKDLNDSANDLAGKIKSLNEAIAAEAGNEEIKKALAELNTANTSLGETLKASREKVSALGKKAGGLARTAVTTFLTGIL